MRLDHAMDSLGQLASRRHLGHLGCGRHLIDRALEARILLPVRPGWVATARAGQNEVRAVLCGARLTGASALRSNGIWAGGDPRLHLQLPPNSHRTIRPALTPLTEFESPRFTSTHVEQHWVHARPSPFDGPQWRVEVADALAQFARDEADEQLAAAIESAVHCGLLSRSAVGGLRRRLPRRFDRIIRRLNFRAESGLETIARLRLEDAGLQLAQQQWIGPDRVDLVIDGWLVVELDGDEWHDPVKDRQRTNRLIRAGFMVLRFGYVDVFERWGEVLETIRVSCGGRMDLV